MARPTSTPRWSSTSPGTTTVEPTSGKKDVGWSVDERPPAKYMNWLFYWIYQWILWFEQLASAAYMATSGYVSGAGWTVDAGSLRITTTTNTSGWHVPLRVAAGSVLNLADLNWRVTPGGATNTVTCGLAIYNDGTVQASASKASTAGAVAETVNGTGATVSVGAFPYTVAAGDVLIATFVASGGGAGARYAYWFKHTPT